MSNVWAEYDKWDSAFCDVVFGGAYGYQPVFLDVEDSLLVQVARRRGLDLTAEQAESALATHVRATLLLGAGNAGLGVFSAHRRRLDVWRWKRRNASEDRAAAPPVIALLAVFARAAELMGRDDQYTSAAYFPRLYQLLDIDVADQGRVAHAYRRESERLWGTLNSWLDSIGGARGLATAEAIGHRYVGIALSQALIRDADRQLLADFFVSKDLEPGLRLGHEDMAAYLESWIKDGHGSGSMRNLMKNTAGRKVLAEAAALALVQWDGTFADEGRVQRVVRPPLLAARLTRTGLGGARVQPSFVLRGAVLGNRALPRRWVILSAPGQPKPEVEFDTLSDRLVVADLIGDIDAASLITGQLRIASLGGDDGRQLEVARRPQPVVVLTYLEEAGLFVEVERARLLESHMVLANAAATKPNGAPMFDLDQLLGEVAQPGFVKVAGVPGVPEGWVLYRDVVVARSHDHHEFALDPLKPAQTSVLSISGGFRMPGHAVCWHADVPLDVRGTALEARGLDVRLILLDDDRGEVVVADWSNEEAELADTTEGRTLKPGHYRAEMRASGSTKKDDAVSASTFSLCTSDDPRVRPEFTPLAYLPGLAIGGLGAAPLVDLAESNGRLDATVRGVVHSGSDMVLPKGALPDPVWWKLESVHTEQAVLAEPAAPDSCAITGRHREQIEEHKKGMKYDRAVCLGCGRVKLYRPTAPLKKAQALRAAAVVRSLEHLGSVEGPRAIHGKTLLDALVWLGGGSPHELAHLVRQVEDSVLTVDEILRVLECLGHVDVGRDPSTFALQQWVLAPRALAGLEDGSWFVTGSWDRSSLENLEYATSAAGGTFAVEEDGWLPRRRLVGLDHSVVAEVGISLKAEVVVNAGRTLLASLPSLCTVASALPRKSAHGIFDAEWFNPAAAIWTRVQSIGQPGAYRVRKGFVSSYLFRSQDDVAAGTAARATPQVVKHLACSQRPLLGYEPDIRTLFVPMGADLPGLYGRALSLQSGLPPARVRSKPLLAYQSVSPDVASAVIGLLKG